MAEITFGKPYVDRGNIRYFDHERSQDEYVWHRDQGNRTIKVLKGDGWQLQFDNCLPGLLTPGMVVTIPSGEYHRLIKGISPLSIEIINSTNISNGETYV